MPREIAGPQGMEVGRRWPETNVHRLQPRYAVTEFDAAPGDSVGLNELTTPLWRRKGTIFTAALVGVLLGGLATWLMPPVYRARTSVQLESFNNDQVTAVSSNLPNASPENYLQNQVKVLESDTLAKRVADKIGVTPQDSGSGFLTRIREQLAFLSPHQPTDEERRIKKVKDALTIRTSLQSQVIELFYDSKDPDQAARGANAVTASFVDLNREAREALVRDTTDWLNKQAAELKASIAASNQHLQAFARSAGLIVAGEEGTLAQERTRQTQEELSRAEADRAAKESRFETASKGTSLFSDAAAVGGPLHQYQIDLENMRRELAQLKTLYTPTNYKVERLQAQIAETEKAMEEERKATISRMGNEYAAASRFETLLAEAHDRQLKRAQQEMANDREYNTLKSEIDTTQKIYETVLQKAKEAGAASALRSANIRLIDAADVPSVPYSPKASLNLAIGFALGSLFGIGFVLFTERTDKVTRPGQIHIIDLPELGVIPSARDARALDHPANGLVKYTGRNGDVGLVTRDHGTSIMSDSFRGVLTSILFGAEAQQGPQPRGMRPQGRVVVIASVDMMEGKTTILTNLGVVAAERRQRVLLIDADFRRPRLHEIFNLKNDRGLTDALLQGNGHGVAEYLPLDALIQPTTTPNLSIMTSGPVDAGSTSLLLSSDVQRLLERCRNDFDLVLVDTPPLMLYTDARILGRLSDGLVMVIRANMRSQDELRSFYERLREDQIPVLGTILNDWRMDPGQHRAYARYRDHYQRGA